MTDDLQNAALKLNIDCACKSPNIHLNQHMNAPVCFRLTLGRRNAKGGCSSVRKLGNKFAPSHKCIMYARMYANRLYVCVSASLSMVTVIMMMTRHYEPSQIAIRDIPICVRVPKLNPCTQAPRTEIFG